MRSPSACDCGRSESSAEQELSFLPEDSQNDDHPCSHHIIAAQPYPLLFATISGAHLYGFASPGRGLRFARGALLPLDAVVGLEVRDETVEDSRVVDGLKWTS
ncbi:MAG: hypothetical protein AB1813_15385 [Verrucomicrobiota bacterium]|jgi:hypothetical protein